MAVGSFSQARLEEIVSDPTYHFEQFQNQPKLVVAGRTKWRNNFISLVYHFYFIFILKSWVNWAGFSFINFEYPFALFIYSIKAASIQEGLSRDWGLLRSNSTFLFAGLIQDLLNLIKRRLASKITYWHMQILVWFSYCFLDVTGVHFLPRPLSTTEQEQNNQFKWYLLTFEDFVFSPRFFINTRHIRHASKEILSSSSSSNRQGKELADMTTNSLRKKLCYL